MFENILGNDKNKEILQNLIRTKSISHSYIFIGEERYRKVFAGKRICKSNPMPRRT